MNKYFAYIRVSTARQGEQGVSLQEQKDAIERYAQSRQLEIADWFEERMTAAKGGRPVFSEMLKLLKKGRAQGVVIHKIDRSARNLKDWSNLGEMIDQGIEVHFANESLDLHTRGGRLSADIQAVVAADYIRNLKEETRKGILGRLKQGLYPLPAPIGYLDKGKGQPKELDQATAPYIRKAFKLYATGRYNLNRLLEELQQQGLRNKNGTCISRSGLSTILNNPFYIGLMRIKSTGEIFSGIHPPLIRKSLFDRVQNILQGKTIIPLNQHPFIFKKLLICKNCGYTLIGEKQKGHIYYRCHTKSCPTTCVREELIEEELFRILKSIQFSEKELKYLHGKLLTFKIDWHQQKEDVSHSLVLKIDNISSRLTRLTDAFVDGNIEKDIFDERKGTLLMERKSLEEQLHQIQSNQNSLPDQLQEFLELTKSVYLSYQLGNPEEKRDLLKIITSNRFIDGKKPLFTLSPPFFEVANRYKNTHGSPHRYRPRTFDSLWHKLVSYFQSQTTCKDKED